MLVPQECLISIIIATYNRSESLRTTLYSLLQLDRDGPFDYEVIVADNNSSDATRAVVESLRSEFQGRLKYLFEPRQGKSYALNQALAECRGEVIAFTDDDCIVEKNWLTHIHQVFTTRDIDLLGGKLIPIFQSPKPEWMDLKRYKSPLVSFNLGDQYLEDNHQRKILPIGANMAVKRESYRRLGGFSFEGRSQDTEFIYNWLNGGAKFAYSPSVLVYHTTPPDRLTKNYLRKYYFLAGKNYSLLFKEECTRGRRFLGISLWVYRQFCLSVLRFCKGLVSFDKNNFWNETRIYRYLGMMYGTLGLKTNFENLR